LNAIEGLREITVLMMQLKIKAIFPSVQEPLTSSIFWQTQHAYMVFEPIQQIEQECASNYSLSFSFFSHFLIVILE